MLFYRGAFRRLGEHCGSSVSDGGALEEIGFWILHSLTALARVKSRKSSAVISPSAINSSPPQHYAHRARQKRHRAPTVLPLAPYRNHFSDRGFKRGPGLDL